MKNLFLFLFLLFLLGGCSDDEEEYLSLSCNTLTFTSVENVKEVVVKTNTSWRISTQLPSWITIEMTQGNSGCSNVIVKVSDNETDKSRSHIITIVTSTKEEQLQIVQKAVERLSINGERKYEVTCAATKLLVEINSNVDYELMIPMEAKEWIKYVGIDNVTNNLIPSMLGLNSTVIIQHGDSFVDLIGNSCINLEIEENQQEVVRHAEIVISNERFALSDTLYITQEAGDGIYKHLDGEYVQLQQATKGNGVNLVIMGDGFVKEDLGHKDHYEIVMKKAMDYFFSIEPYKSYRDYFNIYMVIAESEEEGISINNALGGRINNKFSTTFGDGTAITCNDDLVFEYARKIKELPSNKPLTIIMPLNSTKYAGTTYLYSNGNSIALCPMSSEVPPNDFEGLIHHEAGGHGFGFLCDEYVYYKTKMPDNRKNDLREWQKLGFQCNLDFTDDLSSILWKDFIGIDKYAHVGAYEGGYEYQYGVWRSESNSCMNNNIPYYNVQSRWSIVSRIMKLAGIDFTVQDFIETDHTTSWSSSTRGVIPEKQLPPLGNPKLIK